LYFVFILSLILFHGEVNNRKKKKKSIPKAGVTVRAATIDGGTRVA
jgi:hypothetical protein